MANALIIIALYKYEGMWVFDDPKAGLNREPFVEGANEIIDLSLKEKGILNADAGFRLIFSAGPFPNYDLKFEWLKEAEGGNYYKTDQFDIEAWLCPALLKYFNSPPQHIYARIEPKS